MRRGRPKAELVVTDDERAQLTPFARSRSLPASLSARARIVLSNAEGEANSSIAAPRSQDDGRDTPIRARLRSSFDVSVSPTLPPCLL